MNKYIVGLQLVDDYPYCKRAYYGKDSDKETIWLKAEKDYYKKGFTYEEVVTMVLFEDKENKYEVNN